MKNVNKHGSNRLTLPDSSGVMGENFQKIAADLFPTVYLSFFSSFDGGVITGGNVSGNDVDSLNGRIVRGKRG